jgi:hypothetical protein
MKNDRIKNDRIKNDRIKRDRIKSGRIKSDSIKADRIKRITDPFKNTRIYNRNRRNFIHFFQLLDISPIDIWSEPGLELLSQSHIEYFAGIEPHRIFCRHRSRIKMLLSINIYLT